MNLYNDLPLPDLADSIYEASNVPEAISHHIERLNTLKDNLRAIDHAHKFAEFRDFYVTDRKYRAFLRDNIFNSLYELLEEHFPDLCFFIEGRTKSLIKFNKKLYRLDRQNRSTDLLRDQMAFRIVFYGIPDSKILLAKVREAIEQCAIFCIKSGFSICDIDNQRLFYTGAEEFKYKIKDYYSHPKKSRKKPEMGYKALHAVFKNVTPGQFYGRYFELQLLCMNEYKIQELIEDSALSHSAHDDETYGDDSLYSSFDPNKVNMEGFVCTKDGKILIDVGGVYKASQILYRKKSF